MACLIGVRGRATLAALVVALAFTNLVSGQTAVQNAINSYCSGSYTITLSSVQPSECQASDLYYCAQRYTVSLSLLSGTCRISLQPARSSYGDTTCVSGTGTVSPSGSLAALTATFPASSPSVNLAVTSLSSSTIGADINVSGFGTCAATYTYTGHPLITELLRIQSGGSSSTSGGSSSTTVTPTQALQNSCSGSTRVSFQNVAESVCADAPVAACARGGYTMTFTRASVDCVAQLTPLLSSANGYSCVAGKAVISLQGGSASLTGSFPTSDPPVAFQAVGMSNSAVQLRLVASGATCTTTFSVGSHPLLEQLQQSGALPGVGSNGGAAEAPNASHLIMLLVLLVSALCLLL